MKNITIIKRSFAIALVMLALFSFFSSDAKSQAKRGCVFEEFTGVWCPHCPPGAWALDSLERINGDNLVIFAWHGGPGAYDPTYEPFVLRAQDTLAGFFGIGGYPWGAFNRAATNGFGFAGTYPKWVSDPLIAPALKKLPTVDFRIVNAVYDPVLHTVDFDVDVTPYDMSKMMSEDTTNYSTISALAEDNIIYDQANAGDGGIVPAGTISNFHHFNVVRKVGGSAVLGDKIVLGTGDPSVHLPVRQHYTMSVSDQWVPENLRIKAFPQAIHPKNKNTISVDVLEAKQTKYITTLPSFAPDAVWIVLPNGNSTTSPTVATNIIWANGGNASSNVKLEYSLDSGKTFSVITNSTTNSPYSWTIPKAAFGGNALIRVSDASNAATKSNSEFFKTPGIINVLHPAPGEVIDGGTADYKIVFSGGNYTKAKKFEYSLDNGVTWKLINNVSSDATNYNWALVPNTATTTALVRISDGSGIVGVSGNFTINTTAGAGVISNLALGGVVSNKIGTGTTMNITWEKSGVIGTNAIVEYSTNNQITWTTIATVPSEQTNTTWKTPDTYQAEVFIRVKGSTAGSATSNAFQVGSPDGNVGSITLGGVVNHSIGRNTPMTITWTTSGEIGQSSIVEWTTDGLNWTNITTVLSTVLTTNWTTPDQDLADVQIRVRGNVTGSATSEKFNIGTLGVYSPVAVGGYSITNFPNPIASQTSISFVMAERGVATLIVRDELGREIKTLTNSTFEAGPHEINFDASTLAAGVYTCTFEANGVRLVKKMSVTK